MTRRVLVVPAVLGLWLAGCGASGRPQEKPTPPAPQPSSDRAAPATPPSAAPREPRLASIRLPQGFAIDVFASGIPGARSLTHGPAGTVFVGTRDEGKVWAVTDRDADGRADAVRTIASDLNVPNGVAFRDGSLWVAEISRILRFDGVGSADGPVPQPVVVVDDLPRDEHHGWKFIAFGPDGRLYVPVGAPCNVCDRPAPYSSILRMRPDGSDREVFARGVRNTVGFDWNPADGVLWFTDNGRDQLGDDVPPDELNRAPEAGLDFGFPHCHGRAIADPAFGRGHACTDYRPPAIELGPHVAALGMRFYTGKSFPEAYRGQIFVAEHGSWNRSTPIGYRVSVVRLRGNEAVSYEPFAEGWLTPERAWGRPVDVLVLADGSLLVSDDRAGQIYRIRWAG